MSEDDFDHCGRVIPNDKYEHNDPSNELWWKKLFEELEAEFKFVCILMLFTQFS